MRFFFNTHPNPSSPSRTSETRNTSNTSNTRATRGTRNIRKTRNSAYTTSMPCSSQSFRLISFSLNFWILPEPVRGNWSMKNTYLGIL